MRVRRCAVLFFESRDDVGFDLESLLTGGAGLSRTSRWLAMAPHLDSEVEIDAAQRELLGALSPGMWVDSGTLPPHRADTFESLLREGLVIADDGRHVDQRERDEAIRAANWWSLAALFHRQGR
jgi:hypothetical protein